jgi:hypothetical protein
VTSIFFVSIGISFLVGLIFIITSWHSNEVPFGDVAGSLDSFSLLSISILASFCFSFALLGFLQEIYSIGGLKEAISQELQHGSLSLRVASWILGIEALLHVCRLIETEDFNIWGDNDRLICEEVQGLPERIPFRAFEKMICIQYLIYIGSISALWVFSYLGIANSPTKLLSWAFFFIADDWVIVSDYAKVFKGRMLLKHRLRLTLFKLLYGLFALEAIPIVLLMLYYTYRLDNIYSFAQVDRCA